MHTKQKLNVLVYGATGAQANPVVGLLLSQGHTPVVFTRDGAKAQAMFPEGVEVFEGDMHRAEDTMAATRGVDAVAMLIPHFMPDRQGAGLNIIAAAKAQQVGRLVWNTSGPVPAAKTGDPEIDWRVALKAALADSGVPFVTLQPTVYAENLLGPWTLPFVAQDGVVAYPVPEHFKMGWLPAQDMGKVVVAALGAPGLLGRHLVVSGLHAMDGARLAEAFTLGLGQTITYRALPPDAFGALVSEAMGDAAGDALARMYRNIWEGRAKEGFHADMGGVLSTLGVAFTPMHEWVRAHKALFLGNPPVEVSHQA